MHRELVFRGLDGFLRRYKPKRDFESAVGLEEVEHLPLEVALFFFCELSSLHSALHEALLWSVSEPFCCRMSSRGSCCGALSAAPKGVFVRDPGEVGRRLPGRGLDTAMVWSGHRA